LRSLRAITDEALRALQPRSDKLFAKPGRLSIAPEKLQAEEDNPIEYGHNASD
jgi:hypothetical protein